MNVLTMASSLKMYFGAATLAIVLMFGASPAVLAASASLSPASLNLTTGQSGSSVFSGDDGRSSKTFKWSYPSGLSVSKGSYSNLSSFSISTSYRTITIKTAGKGSFSATLNFSSSSTGTYTVKNTSAGFSFSPKDITVTVSSSQQRRWRWHGWWRYGWWRWHGWRANNGIEVLNAANGVTLQVRSVNKTMSDGNNVTFWVFCNAGGGGGGMGGCAIGGPVLELGVGQTANVTLNMMMAPQENPPYHGHTIHWHGMDVYQSEDGVPETGAAVLGDNYRFSVDSRYVGSHMYHCHVHTVKHLEMGMYAPIIVKAVDGSGNFLNVINSGGPTYDYEWNMMFSSVDPAYHTAVGDSTTFADYNPRYFLVNGNEGRSRTAPAETYTAAPGAKVAMRLMGIQSVNTTFEIKDAGGVQKVVHGAQQGWGRSYRAPRTVTSIDLSPGQTADIMVTLPTSTGSWYPQFTFKNLRNGGTYSNGVTYTRINF